MGKVLSWVAAGVMVGGVIALITGLYIADCGDRLQHPYR